MPVINIKSLPPPQDVDTPAVLQAVVTALSEAIGTPPERIFAGWTFYEAQAEGLDIEATFQSNSHPPIVSVDMFEGRTKEQKVEALRRIEKAIKESMDFGGNPFVFIRDIANAQVLTGGTVIDRS